MIRTRSASKVLNMAAVASRSSANKNTAKIAESDFLAREMDSDHNSKVGPKTLKEKAAMIAAKLAPASKSKEAKGKNQKVVKDAPNPSDQQASPQFSGSRDNNKLSKMAAPSSRARELPMNLSSMLQDPRRLIRTQIWWRPMKSCTAKTLGK